MLFQRVACDQSSRDDGVGRAASRGKQARRRMVDRAWDCDAGGVAATGSGLKTEVSPAAVAPIDPFLALLGTRAGAMQSAGMDPKTLDLACIQRVDDRHNECTSTSRNSRSNSRRLVI